MENVGVEVSENHQHNEQHHELKEAQVLCLCDIASTAPEHLILESPRREGNLLGEERERVNTSDRREDEELPCLLDVASGSVPNTTLLHDGCGSITLPISMGNAHFELEYLNLDLPKREVNLLPEERENAKQNVGLEAVSKLECHRWDHQLEEGELSDERMDQSSEQSGSAQIVSDNEESAGHAKGLFDACGSTRQKSSWEPELAVADVMGSPTKICLPRYFTRSSIRIADAEVSIKKQKLNGSNDNKKAKKTSRKQRKSENKQQKAPKQVASSGSGGTGKDGQQLGAQKGSKKVTVSNKVECTLNANKKTNRKETRETTVKAAGECEIPGNGNVFVPERKKGPLSLIIEEEVGLWTTDAGDDQILTTQTEGLASKKVKRTLTAERKKTKQRAKHRKRAEKEKALGIRKLVFKAPQKKIIKFCQFYVKGRCTKGASCTFSHDIIPRTKSEMCKYYINRCCLKGDDCPFSHDLSSFPCKFFHTRGHCLDGESCRFSHEPISEETRQDLLKKIEREQQARQEGETASNDTLGGKVTPAAMALIAENGMGLQGPEKFMPSLKAQHSLRDESSQGCKPAGLKFDGSLVAVNPHDNKGGNFPLLRPDNEVFARDEGISNSVLVAARQAASTFTSGLGTGTDLSVHRSPRLHAGFWGRTGATLHKNMVSDFMTALVSKENPEQPAPIGIASMLGASGLSVIKSPKSRAMELLQASLEASQPITRSKSPASLEILPLDFSSDHQNELPKSVTNTGFDTEALRSSDSSNMGLMKCLQTSSEATEVVHIPKVQGVMSPETSASTTTSSLNLFRVKTDAPSLNKRPTVDNLLSKILME